MNKLRLANFKAFEGDLVIDLSGQRNLLLYGENGSGKTSIYEAIKVAFFHQRLEKAVMAPTPEDTEQLRKAFWSSFNNKIADEDFVIEVDDVGYQSFSTDGYQVFMISIEDLIFGPTFNLRQLLHKSFLHFADVEHLCHTYYQRIQDAVNDALRTFMESVAIEIDREDGFSIKVIDVKKKLERKDELRRYFNEAKLNMIVLLLLLNAIRQEKRETKLRLLVLDDFITSLDASNRVFITRYIFQHFGDSQIVILTHNIGFFNLMSYIIRTINEVNDRWTFCNLYEINNNHRIYDFNRRDMAKTIKQDFKKITEAGDLGNIEDIGNRIRRRFEVLLNEYAKLLVIGGVEESRKILERITTGKTVYFDGGKTALDLIEEIEGLLRENSEATFVAQLQSKINRYKKAEFPNIQAILKDLKLYKKVTMHPMSHGVNGLAPFTIKEVANSIELLERLENVFRDLVGQDVSTV